MNADVAQMNVPQQRIGRSWLRWPAARIFRARFTFICATSAFICVYTAFLPSVAAAALSLTDDAGRRVELKAPAQRIVSLAPFLTELAYSAGAGAQLVGVSAYSDYPPEARRLPQVASAMGPEIEPLAALRPDLVLAWQDSIRREDVDRIERLGIPVFVARARRLDDVPRLLEAIGTLAGRDVAGRAKEYRSTLANLDARYRSRPRVRVFVEVWHKPLTTIAGTHWINEALALCGGENVFGDLEAVAPVVSWEELYRRDPRLVLGAGSDGGEAAFRANWASRSSLAAVAAGRAVFVDADTLQRPTLRLANGVAAVCAALEKAR
jgi:iron complex transport system substrate-binding protein